MKAIGRKRKPVIHKRKGSVKAKWNLHDVPDKFNGLQVTDDQDSTTFCFHEGKKVTINK